MAAAIWAAGFPWYNDDIAPAESRRQGLIERYTMAADSPVGEIVESTTTSFVAQCLELPRQPVAKLFDPPPFGAFVKIVKNPAAAAEDEPAAAREESDPFDFGSASGPSRPVTLTPSTVYALVFGSATTSLEPFRRPSALGYDEDELRTHQPQIFELLRTEFHGLLAGFTDSAGTLRRHLPPTPPRIHARVYSCGPAEIRALTADLSFLRGVLVAGGALNGVPVDELAAACLREARAHQPNEREFLVRAGKSLASILAEDYDRLQAILRNVL